MALKFIKHLGNRAPEGKFPQRWGLFLCSFCGKEVEVRMAHAKRNLSCGCARGENITKAKIRHNQTTGGKQTKLYTIWRKMRERCTEPRAQNFSYYGGKGVAVCQNWMDKFDSFQEWAVASGYQEGLEIDRIDSSGDYSPENCRWVTRTQNARNRSSVKLSMGKAREIRKRYKPGVGSALAKEYGVSTSVVSAIIHNKIWKENVRAKG